MEKILDTKKNCKAVFSVGICQGLEWKDATVEICLVQKLFDGDGELITDNMVTLTYDQFKEVESFVNQSRRKREK